MKPVGVGFVFRAKQRRGQTQAGLHRVIEVNGDPDDDNCLLVVIQIPEQPPPRQSGTKQASYYSRGFKRIRLEALRQLLKENLATVALAPPVPAWWSKSDADFLHECPKDRWVRQGESWVAPEIHKRETKWTWIEPLVARYERKEIQSVADLDALVPARATELKLKPNQVYDALHRYFAFGEIKDALLPNTPLSGGKGQVRYGKNGVRLGAPNAAAKAGNTELAGKICDEQDRQNMRDGYQMFVRRGVSRKDSFLAFSSTYYSDGYKVENGYQLPLLLPARQRPTEREFFDHGPEKQDRYEMLRRIFGEAEWAKDYRSLIGTAQDGIHSLGQVGSIDASPIDLNLVSCFDCQVPIGVPRGLFVREAKLGLWCGAHNVIGGPGTDDALLTILRSALSKAKILRRLNLDDIHSDDIPDFLFVRLLSDNGELRAIKGIETCAEKVRTTIEFVESGRADRNSPSEAGHHARHAGLDHKLPGTTYGRRPKRGEALPISKALLNLYGYERLLWQWMHWANTKQLVPHLVPTEMKRDMVGKPFLPTRIEIYRWADRQGLVTRPRMDPLYLKSVLLPVYTASVARNGLILHRPRTGERVELLKAALFNSDYIQQTALYHNFGSNDPRHVQVRVDPDDLSEIILIDRGGVHVIPNVTNDVIVVREYYLPDLVAVNDANRLTNIETKSEVDQAGSDLRLSRAAEVDRAQAKRKAAEAEGGEGQTTMSKEGVRDNQKRERAEQLQQAAERAVGFNTATTANRVAASPVAAEVPPSNVVPLKAESRLRLAQINRMKAFLDKGG